MRWATRAGVHVDRAACAWLVRRFIDLGADFAFVADPDDIPIGAVPFDIGGAELSHRDGLCSFETILRRYGLSDPALWAVARIVHEADLADERYDAPEGRGLDVLMRGLSMTLDDEAVLAASGPLFDGLYEYEARAVALGREPA